MTEHHNILGYTIKGAAAYKSELTGKQVSPKTIQSWINHLTNTLPAQKEGKQWRIQAEDIEAYTPLPFSRPPRLPSGKRIQEIMKQKNLTVRQFAEDYDVVPNSVYIRIKRDKKKEEENA